MYLQAHPCDSIYFPFEFDGCPFYCLTGSLSQRDNYTHTNLIEYIRRVNLNAFWSRTQGTLYHLTHMFSEEVTTVQNLGSQMFPTSPVPFPAYYYGGMRSALGFLTR